MALQQVTGALHVALVIFQTDLAHARRRATLDLVQQTRPMAVAKHRIFAGAQTKDFLNQLNRFTHRPYAGIRAKVFMVFVDRAAVIHHPWCGFGVGMPQAVNCAMLGAGDFQIGIAFIVTK